MERLWSQDTNGDGCLDIEELVRAFEAMGVAAAPGPRQAAALAQALMKHKAARQASQQSAHAKSTVEGLCAVCMEAPRAVRLKPCGHASTCTSCTLKLIDARQRRVTCPLCKKAASRCDWSVEAETAYASVPRGAAVEGAGGEGGSPPPLLRMATFDDAPDVGKSTPIVAILCDPVPRF